MNWKIFITASVNLLAVAFPGNGITCGPTEDPHDYFTSFFSRSAGNSEVYRPFYYTSLLKLYDDADYSDSVTYDNDPIIEEWMQYTASTSSKEAVRLVYKSTGAELQQLATNLKGNKPLPSAFQQNQLVKNLVASKKTAAIDYLRFAKKVEGSTSFSAWEETKRKDSLELNRYISEANAEFERATDPFLKNKFAFQRCKLAFYNNRHADCIKWYEEYFTSSKRGATHQPALSYKAGSLFRMNRKKEAAYDFSRAFAMSDQNKKQNFLGFLWASNYCDPALENDYMALCKNDKEKATMKGMFAMHGVGYRLDE